MKNCPYCDEEIKEAAVKCRFCGEFLDGNNQPKTQQIEFTGKNIKQHLLLSILFGFVFVIVAIASQQPIYWGVVFLCFIWWFITCCRRWWCHG